MELTQSRQDLCVFQGFYQQSRVKLLPDLLEAVNSVNALSDINQEIGKN